EACDGVPVTICEFMEYEHCHGNSAGMTKMPTLSSKSSELSRLISVRDEIRKEDQASWLAVVELSLFLTQAWADFLFPHKKLPHARELMLVGGVIFIWDLKGKPLTETGVSRVIGMPRATLARRIDL